MKKKNKFIATQYTKSQVLLFFGARKITPLSIGENGFKYWGDDTVSVWLNTEYWYVGRPTLIKVI